jgi:hypothetical protein
MSRAALLIPLVWLAMALVGLTPARAAFGPFTVVSGSPQLDLPAEYAYDAAISSNGEYVAYTGSIAGQPGVYRMNLTSGRAEVEVVALGAHTGAPSISEEGQYVSFTTDENPLTGEPTGGSSECSSVYVRDMKESPQSPGAYTLVSARNGSTESLSYAPPSEPHQACGSASSYRAAISGNGNEVAFTVLSPSDLTSAKAGQTETPAGQVAVRFLEQHRTELVSVTRPSTNSPGGEPVPGGGALIGPGILEGLSAERPISDSTAAISANGNAVAWMGINVQAQTELVTPPPDSGGYAEPLWRNIEEEPQTQTRSVLSGGDPSATECPPSCEGGLDLLWNVGVETTLKSGPIYGSFPAPEGYNEVGTVADHLDVVTPQLSANGNEVALLSTQPNYGEDPQYPPNFKISPPTANAFIVNMTPGLTRAQSITRLTAWASLSLNNIPLAGPIEDIAISPDGTRVAFITQRISFPLAPPALISPPLSQYSNLQLYEANLPAGTLELVSRGYDGLPANQSTLDVSLNEDGSTVALTSFAGNLAFGAGGTGGTVFVTHEVTSPPGSGQQTISPRPTEPPTVPAWRISATASPGPDGSLLLYVSVPGAGSLGASAIQAFALSTLTAGHPSSSGDHRGAGRAAARQVAAHTVARATSSVKEAGVVRLRLTLSRAYKALLDKHKELFTNITVTFKAAGHPSLSEKLQASFHASPSFYALPKRKRTAVKSTRRATGASPDASGRGK